MNAQIPGRVGAWYWLVGYKGGLLIMRTEGEVISSRFEFVKFAFPYFGPFGDFENCSLKLG